MCADAHDGCEPATSHTKYFPEAGKSRPLENLKEHSGLDCEVLKWDTADYRYRMIVPADKIAGVFTTLLDSIDYSNFKSQIGRTEDQIEKLHAYHEIWGIMNEMQR